VEGYYDVRVVSSRSGAVSDGHSWRRRTRLESPGPCAQVIVLHIYHHSADNVRV
jgi:hypothetical protein